MQHREVNLAVQAVTPQKNRHSEPGQYSHDSKQFTWMIQEVQVHVEGSSILCFYEAKIYYAVLIDLINKHLKYCHQNL
jgi:hypothetical protein